MESGLRAKKNRARRAEEIAKFMSTELKLYVKTWCPWCVRAEDWLRSRGYTYRQIDVEANRADYDEMIQLSGQTRTPTLVTGDGKMLPDFGPDELAIFVQKHDITP